MLATAGCATPSPLFNSQHASLERSQRLLEIAAEYDRNGQPAAAIRIYDHLLAQQPANSFARERRDLLAQQVSNPPFGQQNGSAPVLAAGPPPQGSRAGNGLPLATPAPTPSTSLEQELLIAEQKRPKGVDVELSSEVIETAAPLAVEQFRSEGWEDLSVSKTAVRPAPALVSQQNEAHQISSHKTIPQPPVSGSAETFLPPITVDKVPERMDTRSPAAAERAVSSGDLPVDLKQLISQLESSKPAEQIAALEILKEDDTMAKAVMANIQVLLRNPDPLVRFHAANSLQEISNRDSIKTYCDLLTCDHEQLICLAAYQLGQMGPAALAAIEKLQKLQDSAHGIPQLYAAEAIMKITPHHQQAIAVLVNALDNEDSNVRWLSAIVLGNVTGDIEADAAEALRHAIHDQDPTVRVAICLSLGGLGHYGTIATNELKEIVRSDRPDVKEAAEISLLCLNLQGT